MFRKIRLGKAIEVIFLPDLSPNLFVVKILKSSTTNYSSRSRSHYEVLGLKNTCTTKDIKKAYIKLCKELHPDKKPGDTSQHKKFIELNNAYHVLINETSRKSYDSSSNRTTSSNVKKGFYYRNEQASSSNPFKNTAEEEPWYERDVYKEQEELFRRQKQNSHITLRVRQSYILYGCFLLICGGCIMYYAAYSYAKNYVLKKVDERSRIISENSKARQQIAEGNGQSEQLKKLKRNWDAHE